MADTKQAVVYEDAFGFTKPGTVFYPESLRLIAEALAELNGEEILHPKSFNANIGLYLDLILGRFRSFHDTHRAAQAIHARYRAEGRPYCLYLRSFVLGGMVLGTGFEGGRLTQQLGLIATDRTFREFLKTTLPAEVDWLSFINIYDLYPSGNEQDEAVAAMKRVTIPSFRLLNHNWKDVVREVVRGARLIVLHAHGESEGLGYEMRLVRECGLAHRTIVAGNDLGRGAIESIGEFHDAVDLGKAGMALEGAPADRLRDVMGSLWGDDFEQRNEVEDLSGLRCWVVDRDIDAAAKVFDQETLDGLPYDHYIPSSLASNWTLLQEQFPRMIEDWRGIEERARRGALPGVQTLSRALYGALGVFYVAVTLERYREMALALSTLGMAHRAITRELAIMAACYGHAAQCAAWLGDADLIEFLQGAHQRLAQEVAASKGP